MKISALHYSKEPAKNDPETVEALSTLLVSGPQYTNTSPTDFQAAADRTHEPPTETNYVAHGSQYSYYADIAITSDRGALPSTSAFNENFYMTEQPTSALGTNFYSQAHASLYPAETGNYLSL